MGQVPVRYGLVGSGRLAKHLIQYFQFLQIPVIQWSRKYSATPAAKTLKNTDVVLMAVSDGAIDGFIENFVSENNISENLGGPKKKWIHFSGALTTPLAQGFHPLMTFGEETYEFDVYKKMVFVVEEGPDNFEEIFPSLPNKHFTIQPKHRGLYHALCVMSGNFTVLLWEKFFVTLEKTFNIPRSAAYPYLERVCANLTSKKTGSVLTGPLQRGDQKTIEANLTALEKDSFRGVYRAFVDAYRTPASAEPQRRDYEQRP